MLDPAFSRRRQERLLDVMERRRLDAIIVGLPHHVYYLSAYQPFWLHQAAFALFRDGRTWLICGKPPDREVAAVDVTVYEADWLGTQRQEQPAVIAELLYPATRGEMRIGLDASPVSAEWAIRAGQSGVSIDEDVWQLRRQKDPDELELMKTAIACTKSMHERARRIVGPGILETHVYSDLHAAAVEVAGEPLSAHLGNDYACGVPGGPPRKGRAAHAGELYILDLGPAYRGYFADNSRAIAVDRKPTDAQMRAWEALRDVFPIVERIARAGTRCRDLFEAVDAHLRRATGGQGLSHHLGHGVGLQPHEFPHLNPKWDDTLLEGEVFTAEPGLYGPELAGGIRLENQYLVTADGVTNLTPFPLGLV